MLQSTHGWGSQLRSFNLVKTDSQGLSWSLRTRTSTMGQIEDTCTEFCVVDRVCPGTLGLLALPRVRSL